MTTDRLQVFVTVGMGPWPFDRMLRALAPVCERHDVFAQTGTSSVQPPCPSAAFVGWTEMQRRMRGADVVITHGGNTVRLVQRLGKVPIAVPREAARGEMRNDHQVEYLSGEQAAGRVVVRRGELDGLLADVERHAGIQAEMLADAAVMPAPDGAAIAGLLTEQLANNDGSPFARHPTRRYAWAYDQLRHRRGRHLDLGCGDGVFARAVHHGTKLTVVGADAHHGYLVQAGRAADAVPVLQMSDRIPLADGSIDSVSMLDSLEHVADEGAMLREVHRILRPGGVVVITVPARYAFSALDPDNAKFRAPRLHAAVYRARFGRARYVERFVDLSDGLRGDQAATRTEHTNYAPADLLDLLDRAGFVAQVRDGSNLFWRFVQVPQLLLPERPARLLDRPLRADGVLFHRANLFLRAVRADR